jgi:hypothetical protein
MPATITDVAATNIVIALVAPTIENVPSASNAAPSSGDPQMRHPGHRGIDHRYATFAVELDRDLSPQGHPNSDHVN